MRLSRWPILTVGSVQVASAQGFPLSWTTIASNLYRIVAPSLGEYGTSDPGRAADGPSTIEIAPGYIDWSGGRESTLCQVQYINGWPHGGLTANIASGVNQIPFDDCTGMVGTSPTLYDGANTEVFTITAATATSGPGTLTTATNTVNAHNKGLILSNLPATVQLATIYLATAHALERGAQAISVPGQPGTIGSGGAVSAESLRKVAEDLLMRFTRVI